MDFVANFSLENPSIEAEFELSEPTDIDATFQINVAPSKVSQLENDLNFQTGDEVAASIQAESEIINARIDEIDDRLIDTIVGNDLLGVGKEENTVTLTPKTYIFEQGIASNVWTINHNLNKFPSVTVEDTAGTIFTAQVDYIDSNTCIVYINGSTKGKAYLN